jgi:hypothetical protein
MHPAEQLIGRFDFPGSLYTDEGVWISALIDPIPAVYAGSLQEFAGRAVRILGICHCDRCESSYAMLWVARVVDSPKIITCSRPSSFIIERN